MYMTIANYTHAKQLISDSKKDIRTSKRSIEKVQKALRGNAELSSDTRDKFLDELLKLARHNDRVVGKNIKMIHTLYEAYKLNEPAKSELLTFKNKKNELSAKFKSVQRSLSNLAERLGEADVVEELDGDVDAAPRVQAASNTGMLSSSKLGLGAAAVAAIGGAGYSVMVYKKLKLRFDEADKIIEKYTWVYGLGSNSNSRIVQTVGQKNVVKLVKQLIMERLPFADATAEEAYMTPGDSESTSTPDASVVNRTLFTDLVNTVESKEKALAKIKKYDRNLWLLSWLNKNAKQEYAFNNQGPVEDIYFDKEEPAPTA